MSVSTVFLFGCQGVEFTTAGVEGTSTGPSTPGEPNEPPTLSRFEMFASGRTQTAESKAIDILVVVDNSRSMVHEQKIIADQFDQFVSYIEDADYRIGVITTDVLSQGKENTPGYYGNLDRIGDNGSLYISPQSSNPRLLFKQAIEREEAITCTNNINCATFYEKPLLAMMMAVDKRHSVNRGFFRQDAELVILTLTDEDEQKTAEEQMNNSRLPTANDVLSRIDFHFGQEKKVTAFSISVLPGDKECLDIQKGGSISGASEYGEAVVSLSRATRGLSFDICDTNYGQKLSTMSEFMSKRLRFDSITLEHEPVEGSLVVEIQNTQQPILWNYENGTIYLFPTPDEGTIVNYSYLKEKEDLQD